MRGVRRRGRRGRTRPRGLTLGDALLRKKNDGPWPARRGASPSPLSLSRGPVLDRRRRGVTAQPNPSPGLEARLLGASSGAHRKGSSTPDRRGGAQPQSDPSTSRLSTGCALSRSCWHQRWVIFHDGTRRSITPTLGRCRGVPASSAGHSFLMRLNR